MAEQQDPQAPHPDTSPTWPVTMWTMVAVQVIMTLSFTFLSPVMPLFLPHLGVETAEGVDLWSEALSSITSLIAAFAAPFRGDTAIALVTLGQSHALDCVPHARLLDVGIALSPMPIPTRAAGSGQGAHPFDRKPCLRPISLRPRHRLDLREDAFTPGPLGAGRGSSKRRKVC